MASGLRHARCGRPHLKPPRVKWDTPEKTEALRYWMRHAKGLEQQVAKHRRVTSRNVRHRGVADETMHFGFTRVSSGNVKHHGVVEEDWP